MRYLAVDYGKKRWGIAVSDELGMIASALCVLKAGDYDALYALIAEKKVDTVVVGLPVGLKGNHTAQTERVEKFIRKLSGNIAVPVVTVNEQLSSVESNQVLAAAGIPPQDRKEMVDKVAAAYFLQEYLNNNCKSGF